jgi:hypothetical protein
VAERVLYFGNANAVAAPDGDFHAHCGRKETRRRRLLLAVKDHTEDGDTSLG